MNNLHLHPLVIMIGALLVVGANAQDNQKLTEAAATQRLVVRFVNPLLPDHLPQAAAELGVTPEELLFEAHSGITVEADIITGGYVLNSGETVSEAIARLSWKHDEFLRVAFEAANDELSHSADLFEYAQVQARKDRMEHLRAERGSGLIIIGMTIKRGDAWSSDRLLHSQLVASVLPERTREESHKSAAIGATREASLPWIPYMGTSKVLPGFIFQTFHFDDVSGFATPRIRIKFYTYEHETWIHSTTWASYGQYWSTNMPSPYRDTLIFSSIGFEGSKNIFNPAIGTWAAESLKVKTQYWTYIELKPGRDAERASVLVQTRGQRGTRPPGCGGASIAPYCVSPETTSGSLVDFFATANRNTTISWKR